MKEPKKVSGHSPVIHIQMQPSPILVPTRVMQSSALAVDARILAHRGLSDQEIAKALGVTPRHVARLIGQQR